MHRFFIIIFFAFPLAFFAADLAEKLNDTFFQTAPDAIESNYAGWIPGNAEKNIWCAGNEDKPTLGELPLVEARLFMGNAKPEKLLLIAYRYASATEKLNAASGMELFKKLESSLAATFPTVVGKYSDRVEYVTLTGTLRRGSWGETMLCCAALPRGPVVILAGIYPVGRAPRRLVDFFTQNATFRHRAYWDADKEALLFPVPDGAPGLANCGFASATARLAAYYGVILTPAQVQEAIGGKEKTGKDTPTPAPPAENGKKKKAKKASASKGDPVAGKDATELAVTWRAIRKIEGKLGITCHELLDGDSFLTRNQCNKLKRDYNQAVRDFNRKDRKTSQKSLDFDDNPPEKIPSLHPEILTVARNFNKSGKHRFIAEAERMLERGDLPLWCAMGFKADAKTGKLSAGAPTPSWRIICGINKQTGKLFYVDCYTALEPTEISFDDAWAITLKLYQLSERR